MGGKAESSAETVHATLCPGRQDAGRYPELRHEQSWERVRRTSTV